MQAQPDFQLTMPFFETSADVEQALLRRVRDHMPRRVLAMEVIASMDYSQKCAYVLEHIPETRQDDRLCLLVYWWMWDRLDVILSWDTFADLVAWSFHATQPETVRRRRQEHQQIRHGAGSLLPDEATIERRRALDGAGSPDRWRRR